MGEILRNGGFIFPSFGRQSTGGLHTTGENYDLRDFVRGTIHRVGTGESKPLAHVGVEGIERTCAGGCGTGHVRKGGKRGKGVRDCREVRN